MSELDIFEQDVPENVNYALLVMFFDRDPVFVFLLGGFGGSG